MLKSIIKRVFDIREGELKIALYMQGYIFLVIATLLIIKPTINSLFISELGVENLPFGYLLVAIAAVISSYFYSKATEQFSLLYIVRFTLCFSIISLLILGMLLHLNFINGSVLYVFYTGVAIYAVLSTSQFWVLANLVFNVREAKRLFGFVGAGAIFGGIFGGYLTTILAPFIGNENLIFVSAFLLLLCFPFLGSIWNMKVGVLNNFKQTKRIDVTLDSPFKLIRGSKHLSYLAIIIAVGVIIAKLVDYQFSYIASERITDSDELTSFFGFWLSSFNVASLLLQLFLTRKIVGVWGVGFSLLILPILVFFGGLLFLVFPELWVVILIKAMDSSLKQSINKSAVELIALPLPFQLKKRTKSYIDVVVDSLATGIAGCILIFLIKGLDLKPEYIIVLIILLTFIWSYFVFKVREEYFLSFRNNLKSLTNNKKKKQIIVGNVSFLEGMYRVFKEGDESEIIYMLRKAQEVNDKRLLEPISDLIHHPSNAIKAAALRNLFFLNDKTINLEVLELLKIKDNDVVLAVLEYLMLHADKNESIIFDKYLDYNNDYVSRAALICLAKESRDNSILKNKYGLSERIENKRSKINKLPEKISEEEQIELLQIIGYADHKAGYVLILEALNSKIFKIEQAAVIAAGFTLNAVFIDLLLEKLQDKALRETTLKALLNYGNGMLDVLYEKLQAKETDIQIKRSIPKALAFFNSQRAVHTLISSFIASEDLTVRLECVAYLSKLKEDNSKLVFDEKQIVKLILEECKIYDNTINAMHTQIIVHYLRRKKFKIAMPDDEMNARESLMELLERRLDNGLHRIFKLLELRYSQYDIRVAYHGITSDELENRTNAIEFLDILLNPNLKNALIPIVEASILDITSEEVIETISKNKMTEFDCFENILLGKDLKLKLSVLFLIQQISDQKYLILIEPLTQHQDLKLKQHAVQVKMQLLSNGFINPTS